MKDGFCLQCSLDNGPKSAGSECYLSILSATWLTVRLANDQRPKTKDSFVVANPGFQIWAREGVSVHLWDGMNRPKKMKRWEDAYIPLYTDMLPTRV
ncbi:hypothetical protein L249_7033 [Ophiocordyceps polyrhachis-furcata BCC 54312]|uniref:Uncharacterized protein n=1 Tax=Ophiocordyceps polyrhachis-furcata BCC 54312 TaxID=1330021 RepID=A0A367LLW8_9HYPO|nr:hypothetical protein L249_7033 [Ophiocordyceps polyrhachis-furcata BCC 54312]